MDSTYTFQAVIRMAFIRYFWNFFFWRTELSYERNQEDSISVCSMLQQLDSSCTLNWKIYFSLFPFLFFFLVFRTVELPWPRSAVFLKLIMSSQQFPNYTSVESCFAQELVPFNSFTSKPNIFNSTDKWLTFTAKTRCFAFVNKERNYKLNNWSLP